MTSELQNHPPRPKVGKMRDDYNPCYQLSCSIGPPRAAPWRQFSALETGDSSQS